MRYSSDIRVLETEAIVRRERARMPLKFGAVVMEDALFFVSRVRVENRLGQTALGFGGIFLSDVWAWPTTAVDHEAREQAMRSAAEAYLQLMAERRGEFGHPVDHFLETETEIGRLGEEASAGLNEPMPFLAALVSASPTDAAMHDAFGNVNGIDSYQGYGREHMRPAHEYLARYRHLSGAGAEKPGGNRCVGDFLRASYVPEVPVFHLVGGLDPLTRAQATGGPQDGLPVSLEEWIKQDSLFCLKVKLRGNDLDWDLERVEEVYRRATESLPTSGPYLTADTNERCETPEYMVELLSRLRERSPSAFQSLLYVEQPTHRDLVRYPFRMDRVADLKPVYVDESLTDMSSYDLARELGATGLALKTCKCQSSCLLMVVQCHLDGVPYAVQDLTNPSLALLQSVGLAARIHPVMGVEANSRQFFPEASRDIAKVHQAIVSRQGGVMRTASLRGTGLGFQVSDSRYE